MGIHPKGSMAAPANLEKFVREAKAVESDKLGWVALKSVKTWATIVVTSDDADPTVRENAEIIGALGSFFYNIETFITNFEEKIDAVLNAVAPSASALKDAEVNLATVVQRNEILTQELGVLKDQYDELKVSRNEMGDALNRAMKKIEQLEEELANVCAMEKRSHAQITAQAKLCSQLQRQLEERDGKSPAPGPTDTNPGFLARVGQAALGLVVGDGNGSDARLDKPAGPPRSDKPEGPPQADKPAGPPRSDKPAAPPSLSNIGPELIKKLQKRQERKAAAAAADAADTAAADTTDACTGKMDLGHMLQAAFRKRSRSPFNSDTDEDEDTVVPVPTCKINDMVGLHGALRDFGAPAHTTGNVFVKMKTVTYKDEWLQLFKLNQSTFTCKRKGSTKATGNLYPEDIAALSFDGKEIMVNP